MVFNEKVKCSFPGQIKGLSVVLRYIIRVLVVRNLDCIDSSSVSVSYTSQFTEIYHNNIANASKLLVK